MRQLEVDRGLIAGSGMPQRPGTLSFDHWEIAGIGGCLGRRGPADPREEAKAVRRVSAAIRQRSGVCEYAYRDQAGAATSIGGSWVQDRSVPVVQASHFLRVLRQLRSLGAITTWMENRKYLPVAGKHYRKMNVDVPIGNWNLKWPDFEYLVDRLP